MMARSVAVKPFSSLQKQLAFWLTSSLASSRRPNITATMSAETPR